MELVEGEDLSQRIARGPIPIDEALPIAKQIADALEAAHEQGIVHRDLKPANIKVRPDGAVKVLDFGLAKALEPTRSATATSHAPTITSPAMTTGFGVLLGTVAYMAPERAQGEPVNKRADIWAFGCVLYEMLTGARAFEGEDVSDTLANVLKTQPDWKRLPETTPPAVLRLLRPQPREGPYSGVSRTSPTHGWTSTKRGRCRRLARLGWCRLSAGSVWLRSRWLPSRSAASRRVRPSGSRHVPPRHK